MKYFAPLLTLTLSACTGLPLLEHPDVQPSDEISTA